MKNGWSLFSICLIIALAVACSKHSNPIPGRFYTGMLFGKAYTIDAVGDSTDYQFQIDSIIRAFESNFNVFDPNSTISRYNSFSRRDTVFAFYDSTRAFGLVYDLAKDLNFHTMQYYDPTMNPVKRAWMVARSSGAPEPNLDSLYDFVGFDGSKMDLNEITTNGYEYKESQMRKSDPRLESDFTSLAAAMALDHIGDFFKSVGLKQFRIKYGNQTIAYGNVVDSLNIIPLGVSSDSSDQYIRLRNRAFSSKNTSDKSLMIDPTYGYPADNELVYVAVGAPTLAEAEVFSEAFLIRKTRKAKLSHLCFTCGKTRCAMLPQLVSI
jgi:thiamine biosynthesis lipoprotein ApbE